ncbi:MAG: hypothetical protein E3J71_09430 [Candidatus Stahlbacteria bacterium]|nr:MAG: hypothetical protein E3J71_09430 [Candidatus Stahlbacteria bacterium]
MPDINAEELLEKAWDAFRNDYDKRVREYSESLGREDEEKAKTEHWILWNEYDLMVQLGRFFYDQLANHSLSGIEMHINVNLKDSNFPGYTFRDKLEVLEKELGKVPEVDLIIAQEDSPERFLLCAEAKFFHYAVGRYYRIPQKDIEKDLKRLVTIRDLEISERVVFILFDDYYWIQNEDIESVAENACKEHNITLLKHNSKAKLERWK